MTFENKTITTITLEGIVNKGLKGKLDIIFNSRKSKHRRKAIKEIGDLVFNNPDLARRPGVIQNIFSNLIEIYQRQLTDETYDQIRKIFRYLSTRSLENNDLTMLTCSFISVSDFSVAKQRVLELASAIFLKEVGSTYNQTKRFCQILFRKIKEVVIECAPIEFEDAPGSAIEFWRFVTHLFTQSAVVPCEEQYPQKLWLLNLIKGYAQNDRQILDWLKGYLEFICSQNRNITIFTPSNSSGLKQFDPDNPHIVVPHELQGTLMRLLNEGKKRKIFIRDSASDFKHWYYSNHRQIKSVFTQKCQEIIDDLNFLLLPDGADRVEVELSALYSVGIRAFSFYPDINVQFPDIKLLIRTSKDLCVICDFWGALENFTVTGGDYIFENSTETDYGYLREVMAYVVVDAMHAIVVGNTDPGESITQRPSNTIRSGDHIIRLMRPRRRNLPVGHRASEEARMLAIEHKLPLPAEGKTFVRKHERPYLVGNVTNHPSDVVNTITYSDDTLMKSVLKE